MASRLLRGRRSELGFSSFVDVAINGMGAMFVFLVLYVAVVPPLDVPPLRILTQQLPPAVWFQPYETGIHVLGGVGKYHFQIQSTEDIEALGLRIDPSLGRIGGVPKPLGNQSPPSSRTIRLEVMVWDEGKSKAQAHLDLRILPLAIPFDPSRHPLRLAQDNRDLPEAWVGQPYGEDIAILGGIEPYEVLCEGLPPGLRWQEGRIEGIPLPQAVAEGKDVQKYDIRLLVRDQQTRVPSWAPAPAPQVIGNFRLSVRRPIPLECKGLYPPTARAGVAYQGFIVLRGGSGRFRISLLDASPEKTFPENQIPLGDSGLSVNGRTGEVVGIPRAPANQKRTVQKLSFRIWVKDEYSFIEPIKAEVSIAILPPMQFVDGEEKK